MADMKSYEDLINEIFELREDLGKKKKFATAAKAVEELAKKHGVDFVATEETTYEEYVTILDLIVNKVIEVLNQEMEKLTRELDEQKAIIQDRDEQLESQDGAIQHLKAQNENYAEELSGANQKIKELNKKYDELLAVKWDLMEQARYDRKAFAQVVMQARSWKNKYINTVGWLDMVLEKYEQILDENKELKKQIQDERQKTGDEIAKTNKELELLKKDAKKYAEDKKTLVKYSSVYGKVFQIIVDVFRSHGYDILPFTGEATQNDSHRVRAYELEAAVRTAQGSDRKEERKAKKGQQPKYKATGYVEIRKEIAAEVNKMLEELKVADPGLVEQFYKELGIKGGKIPPIEQIIDKIIDTEKERKPFLKTVSGKVLVIALIAVVLAGVAAPIFIALQNREKPTATFEGLEFSEDDIEDEVEQEFVESPFIAVPGTLPTNVQSLKVSPSGMVKIVYNGYDSLERPIQEVISFQAPAEWLEMGENLTAEFILDNIPKGAEKQRFENVSILEPSDVEDDDIENEPNDAMDSETDIDDEIDEDAEFDDVELEDLESDMIEPDAPVASVPVFDSSAPMVSWNVSQVGGRIVVTGTMIVDGDAIEFTSIGSSVEQCKDDVLSTFWDNGYDVGFEMEP